MTTFNLLSPPRKPCANEMALLPHIFGNSVNWQNVSIYPRRFLPFQAAHVAMSLNGKMYFPEKTLYCNDFTQHSRQHIALFIHEAAHIWQHGLARFALRRGTGSTRQLLAQPCLPLQHMLHSYHDLKQFNMKQQASIIEH